MLPSIRSFANIFAKEKPWNSPKKPINPWFESRYEIEKKEQNHTVLLTISS